MISQNTNIRIKRLIVSLFIKFYANKMSDQKQPSQQILENVSSQHFPPEDTNKKSQQLSEYLNILELASAESLSTLRSSVLKQLQKAGVVSGKQWHADRLVFDVVSHTHNYQCLVLRVAYGIFNFIITVIFVNEESSSHQNKTSFRGNYSTVYKVKAFSQLIAVKCTCFTKKAFKKIFQDNLAEYLILRIMSELQYGPEMSKAFGFDLIVHRTCIQFCMQFGQQKLIMQHKMKADLIEGLRILHSLKIIHFDIKPENIMYSNAFERYVLIDYGLNSIIKEPIGVKTFTYFKGSPNFCSNQMLQCFRQSKWDYVDLYFNDAYCLNGSIRQMSTNAAKMDVKRSEDDQFQITQKMIMIMMKSLIVDQFLVFNIDPRQKDLLYIEEFNLISQSSLKKINSFTYQLNRFLLPNNLPNKINTNSVEIQSEQSYISNRILQDETIFYTSFKYALDQIITKNNCPSFNRNQPTQKQKLADEHYCRQLQANQYIWQLSRHIYFFDFSIQRSQKQKICSTFNSIFIKSPDFPGLGIKFKLNLCYKYLIDYAIDRKSLGNREFQIIKRCFASITFLQVQLFQDYLLLVKRILKIKGEVLRKIRLFITISQTSLWVNQRIISTYCYYVLIDTIFASYEQFLDSLKGQYLNQRYRAICHYVLNILQMDFRRQYAIESVLSKHKHYLLHTYMNDYDLALAQAHIYHQIFSILIEQKMQLSYLQIGALTFYQGRFNYERLPFFLHLSAFTIFSKLIQQYQISQMEFVVESTNLQFQSLKLKISSNKILKKLGQLEKQIKQNEYIIKFQISNNIGNFIQFLALLQSRYDLIKVCSYFDSKEQWLDQLSSKLIHSFSVQNCLSSIRKTYTFYHVHDLPNKIKNMLKTFQRLTKQYMIEDGQNWLKCILIKIDEGKCTFCKFLSLIYLKTYDIMNRQTSFKVKEDFFLQMLVYLIKGDCSGLMQLQYLTTYFGSTYAILSKDNAFVSYSYCLLLFELMKINPDNFDIFFQEYYSNKQAFIFQQMLRVFWQSNPQLYFSFIDSLFKYIVSIQVPKSVRNIKPSVIITLINGFLMKLSSRDRIKFTEFKRENINNYQSKLCRLNNQCLAAYLYALVSIPTQCNISPAVFVYVWQHAHYYFPKLQKFYYRNYLIHAQKNGIILKRRKYDFLQKKAICGLVTSDVANQSINLQPKIKIIQKYRIYFQIHKMMLKTKAKRYFKSPYLKKNDI